MTQNGKPAGSCMIHQPLTCRTRVGAELLQAGDLGVDIGGVDVDVHAAGTLVETLDEEADVLSGDLGPVVLGVTAALGHRLAGRSRPERHLLVVVSGSHVDDDLVEPAVVSHRVSLTPSTGPQRR